MIFFTDNCSKLFNTDGICVKNFLEIIIAFEKLDDKKHAWKKIKVPVMTAADHHFSDIFKEIKAGYFMCSVRWHI